MLQFSPILKNQHFQIPIRSWNARPLLNEFFELLGAPWVNKFTFTFYLLFPNAGKPTNCFQTRENLQTLPRENLQTVSRRGNTYKLFLNEEKRDQSEANKLASEKNHKLLLLNTVGRDLSCLTNRAQLECTAVRMCEISWLALASPTGMHGCASLTICS